MNKFGRAFLVGFAALAMTFGGSSAIAQEQQEAEEIQYISGFTEEEWAIIEREYDLRGKPLLELPGDVIEFGGEGEERWVVIDLGEDDFGNRYFMHSDYTSKGRIDESYAFADFMIFVFYKDPAANNDVVRRAVLMSAKCENRLASRGYLGYVSEAVALTNTAFDADGNVVDVKRQASYVPNRELSRGQVEHANIGCNVTFRYPALLFALSLGQSREFEPSPSLYN